MFFSKLLPHDGNFFEQINQHANCILQAAQALSQLVTHYADPAQRQQYTQQVIDAEDRADAITHAVNTMLHKTFITPIDREQLHQLINAMDDVTDIIHDVAETMSLYDIGSMTAEMVQLTQISLQGCEQLHTVVHQLDKIEKPNAAQLMLEICHTIDQL